MLVSAWRSWRLLFVKRCPTARVVGIDVLPRALSLAEQTITTRGLGDRLEVRLVGVQELADVEKFDLAWMPAPFLPEAVFAGGLRRVLDALRPGGWLTIATDVSMATHSRWRCTFEDPPQRRHAPDPRRTASVVGRRRIRRDLRAADSTGRTGPVRGTKARHQLTGTSPRRSVVDRAPAR